MLLRPAGIHVSIYVLALWAGAVCAAPVDRVVADRVAENWVIHLARNGAAWSHTATRVVYQDVLFRDGTPLAYLYAVEPAGYVMVPLRDELAAVTAYSPTTVLSERTPGGFFDMVGEQLQGKLAVLGSKSQAECLPRHPSWETLDVPCERFFTEDPAAKDDAVALVGPLLVSTWQQGWPFNTLCPWGAGGRTYVGCTALAAAQLLYYYGWPLRGEGERSYWWSGDDACGGSAGETIYASFVEPYAWDDMAPVVNWLSPEETQQAAAELCYEVAVACQTDFSYCGSSASLSSAMSALVTHFRFRSTAREQMRFRFTDAAWFNMIRAEIDAGRPALYSTIIHTMVVDGWLETVGLQQFHINYGWAGESDDWYTLDAIETSYNPQTERVIIGLEPDTVSPMAITRFMVARLGTAAKLTWHVEGVLDASSFLVWRGDTAVERVCLTPTPLAGYGDYVWIDADAPIDETYYWVQELIVGAPSIWAGPVKLADLYDQNIRIFVAERPSTVNRRAALRFQLERDARVELAVYDLAGRRIAALYEGDMSSGLHRVAWNGRDAGGRRASSGVYLIRLRADDEARTLRITLAR
jgi:hypothetical protein